MARTTVISTLLLLLAAPANAQHEHHGTAISSAFKTPTVVAAKDGTLWRAWVAGGHILVGSSRDVGRTWTSGIRVNPSAEDIDANGEARPKIALGTAGEIYVSYTRTGKRPYTGDIRFSRSLDRGRTFSAPVTVNDDGLETGHRFDALDVSPEGAVFVVWIDKRDLEHALAAKTDYAGAAMYYTTSRDRGASFAKNRKIKDHVCECCRIAHAFDARGRLVLFWRDVMDGSIRDHALVRLTPDGLAGPIERVTADGWAIDACPHHGPGLAMGANGSMHIVWFTGEGQLGPGAFYGRLTAEGTLVGTPIRLGPAQPTTGHAVVYTSGTTVVAAWKESRKPGAAVMLIESHDSGQTFSSPREVATTSGLSDHPFLIDTSRGLLLSWFSERDGHRVIGAATQSPRPSSKTAKPPVQNPNSASTRR